MTKHLGLGWIDRRASGARGRLIADPIALLGLDLFELEQLEGFNRLRRRLRRSATYESVRSEVLVGAHLRRRGLRVQIEPRVFAGGRERNPDFLVKGPWGRAFLEVMTPSTSEEMDRVLRSVEELSTSLFRALGDRELSVGVWSDTQLDSERDFAHVAGVAESVGNDLRHWERFEPRSGLVVCIGPRERDRPTQWPDLATKTGVVRLGSATFPFPRRQAGPRIEVRAEFKDTRINRFLGRKAAQLPSGAPNALIFVGSRVPAFAVGRRSL